jgi:alkane 1-monooxygenase
MALYAAMIFDWAVYFKIVYIWRDLEPSWSLIPTIIGLSFIVSNLYAAQFAVAHEIMHKPGKFYRILATLHMVKLYYPHFTHHHLYNHHKHVATPGDPSSAKKGENVYSFIANCITGSWKGVYEEEKEQGKSWYNNYAVLSIFSSIAFAALTWYIWGYKSLIVHSINAIGSVIYLEGINYIEHYGLSRKLLPNGEYEKVTILHSWNAPHRFTNYLLFKLQRHSDHHENASKPYQTLVSLEKSPFLPHGYNLMILMSFFPKVTPSPFRFGSG